MTNLASRETVCSFVRRGRSLKNLRRFHFDKLWCKYGLVPDGYFNFEQIFQNAKPVILEIGFGKGDSLVQMAKKNTHYNYVGIEVYKMGIYRLMMRAHQNKVDNLKIIEGDARILIAEYIKNHSLSGVQLFFPDPWPKKKHHKRRLIQRDFLDLLANKLCVNGFLYIVTDWENYMQQILKIIEKHKQFKKQTFLFKNTGARTIFFVNHQIEYRPKTYFERRGLNLGHKIWNLYYCL